MLIHQGGHSLLKAPELIVAQHFPESKTHPRIPEHLQESKTHPKNHKTHPRIQNTSQIPKHFWILGSILDSGECFWFLGHILGFGTCFGFWDVFFNSEKCYWTVGCVLDSGGVFGFWDMFCPYEPLHELDELLQKRGL